MNRKLIAGLIVSITFFLCALWPASARAQNQNQMTQRAAREFEAADAGLNRVYKRLIGRMDQTSAGKLRMAERAWVAFRDADADFEADRVARGGSMSGMIYYGVRAELTKIRAHELEQTLKDAENR